MMCLLMEGHSAGVTKKDEGYMWKVGPVHEAVKGQCIGLVTAIVDGESQSSKEVTNHFC